LLTSFAMPLQAAESFVVKDIRVEGLQRVEPGTVFSYLPIQVGETFTQAKGAESIKALYSTGFFRDVQIQAQGNVLIVIVEERPTISRIEFTGMKEFAHFSSLFTFNENFSRVLITYGRDKENLVKAWDQHASNLAKTIGGYCEPAFKF
jgi:hypothetical protein